VTATPTQTRALELLQEGVQGIMTSERWQAALRVRARLHRYSFNNCVLILLQRPDASMVAGFHRWQELGRHVRKGEKGLMILAPIVRKTKEGDDEARHVVGFRTAHVFDVSQTEGQPLPTPPAPELLTDDSPRIRDLTTMLECFAASRGHTVERRTTGTALGSYHRLSKRITLRADLPPLQTLKTLVHELAHALLHAATRPDEQRHTLELEAESCAFIVCHTLGLDTSRYSFAYLAGWAHDPAELLPAGERASKAAAVLLEVLEPQEEPQQEGFAKAA
jgi:antirestriction protein ArdC